MPNINLTDSRNRDAVVKAETTGIDETVRYVDDQGQQASTRKILKATVDHDFATLVKAHQDDAAALGAALIAGDPEVDMDICGLYLWGVSKVYVDKSDSIVYRIEQQEIVRGPDGSVREKRPRSRPEANVDAEIPLTWTGKKIAKEAAVRRFVFASKLQIVHINGLTYDFLYGIAKELADANSLMMLGGGSKGREPLIFRSGSVPYRGFLEGRIDGDKYLLLLHLSNLELKAPGNNETKATTETDDTVVEAEKETCKPEESGAIEKGSDEKKNKKVRVKESAADEVAETAPAASKKAARKKTAAKKTTDTKATGKKVTSKKAIDKKATKKKTAKKKTTGRKTTRQKISDKQPTAKSGDESKQSTRAENEKDTSTSKVSMVASDAETQTTGTITSEELGIWLKSIRMGKYLKLFIEHEIDIDVLPELTDEDLKELDIPLGSRRRLLKAVDETDNLHAEVASAVKKMTAGVSSDKRVKQRK